MDLPHAKPSCMSASVSFGELPGGRGAEGIPTSTLCRLGLCRLFSRAGPCALLRRARAECRLRAGKQSVKQLCNPLDADQGSPHSRRGPTDWLGAGTRDRHVAILAQPVSVSLETEWRCCWPRKWGRCWSHGGPACCGGRGRRFLFLLSETGGLSLAQGPLPHAKREGRGGSPPPPPLLQHRRWISCASDPGFLTEEEERGEG